MKVLACSLLFLFLAMAGLTSAAAQTTVVPVNGTPLMLTPVTINAGPGDQNDPHVSGDWASYASDTTIRYYNFGTSSDAEIPPGPSARDLLSDVSGGKIVFSRVIPGSPPKTAVMVFDAASPADPLIEIDPAPGTVRLGSAIGGNTVAYIDFVLDPGGDLVIHDLITFASTRITYGGSYNQSPSVSPDGNFVTWEHCAASFSNCDVWLAVKSGSAWSASAVTESLGIADANPDTNGSLVVYDSYRSPDSHIFWSPVEGGAEVQLEMPGWQANPNLAGNFIAFESSVTLSGAGADIFVYDIAGNRLYQITNTEFVREQLNDITQLPDGRLRVVWASDEDGQSSRNVYAATFSLPLVIPTPTQLLQQLIGTVGTFNLRRGIANSLDAKLKNAQAALAAARSADSSSACGMLGAFIHEVQAQSGKAITTPEATQLINLANPVSAGLACP
jgi:hypothetical protein